MPKLLKDWRRIWFVFWLSFAIVVLPVVLVNTMWVALNRYNRDANQSETSASASSSIDLAKPVKPLPTSPIQPQVSELAPPSVAESSFDIDQVLPRPIETEEDAAVCFQAANAMLERLGSDSGIRTERLNDCVIQYDEDGSYTKFFPDGQSLRMHIADKDKAYVNVIRLGEGHAMLHMMLTRNTDMIVIDLPPLPSGKTVSLIRTDANGTFKRGNGWSQIENAAQLETFALRLWEDFVTAKN